MNDDPNSTHQAAESGEALDDAALGSALRSAIGARVGDTVQTPPVSLIAERAAARARTRTVQRSVVGIAASITLLAGGLVAYNAFDTGHDSPTVATEPTVTTPQTDAPTPQTDPSVDGEATTAPLDWTRSDPGQQSNALLVNAAQPYTLGDGRVAAHRWRYGLIVSDDGNDWTSVDIPAPFSPEHAELSSQRWLVTGYGERETDFSEWPVNQAFYSDDQGTTWTELTFDPALSSEASVETALVSNEHMVIVFKVPPDRTKWEAALLSLIEAEGLVPADSTIESWSLIGNEVGFSVAGDPAEDSEPFESLESESLVLFDSHQHSFTISEQDLTWLESHREEGRTVVYAGEGDQTRLTAEHVSWHTTGSSDSEGFYLAMTTPQDELLLTSSDGITWDSTSIDDPTAFAEGLLTTTRIDGWFVEGYESGIRVTSLSRLPDRGAVTATIPGWTHLLSLDVGPAGMVAVGHSSTGSTLSDSELQFGLYEPQLGWSTDGRNWQLQPLADAFGIEQGEADFAVGTDFVVAHVTEFIPNNDFLEAQPAVWFRATVQ